MQDSFSPPVVLTLDSLGLTIITVPLVGLTISKYCVPKYFIPHTQLIVNNHVVSIQQLLF